MIRSILVYVLTFLSFFCFTQTMQTPEEDHSLKFFNKTEAGVGIGIGSFNTDIYNGIQRKVRNDEIIVSLQTVNGVKYLGKIGIGVSVGAELWQNGFFWPVYVYLGYDLKPADNTFFADLYLGYAFGKRKATSFYHEGKGAFAMNIGAGYKMKLTKKLRFMYEVFYHYQAIESSYNLIKTINDSLNTTSLTRIDYKIPLHFAGFRIGISFP